MQQLANKCQTASETEQRERPMARTAAKSETAVQESSMGPRKRNKRIH